GFQYSAAGTGFPPRFFCCKLRDAPRQTPSFRPSFSSLTTENCQLTTPCKKSRPLRSNPRSCPHRHTHRRVSWNVRSSPLFWAAFSESPHSEDWHSSGGRRVRTSRRLLPHRGS